MPNWNLGTILSNVTRSLGKRADFALSDLSFWANEAAKQVWDAQPQNLQETIAVSSTTSGENRVTLPTDFQELLWISNSSGVPPTPLAPITLWNAESFRTQTGSPTYYRLYADWLELYPTPNSAYSLQLRYRQRLSDMTALTATPSVDTTLHYGVFLKAKELIASNLALDPVAAGSAYNEYQSFMARMPSDMARRNRENKFAGVSLPRGMYRAAQWPSSGNTWGS